VNRKVLVVIVALIAVAMLATPTVGLVNALGKPNKAETFYTIPLVSNPPTLVTIAEVVPPNEKWVGPVIDSYPNPDGSFRSSSGAIRTLAYQGALGTGVLTLTTIHGLGKYQSPTLASGAGTYNMVLDVSGDYGTGTLEGIARLTLWDLDFSQPMIKYYELWTMSLHGKGSLNGLNVFAEAYATAVPLPSGGTIYLHWWNTTISQAN
jgi:hypothetical protein